MFAFLPRLGLLSWCCVSFRSVCVVPSRVHMEPGVDGRRWRRPAAAGLSRVECCGPISDVAVAAAMAAPCAAGFLFAVPPSSFAFPHDTTGVPAPVGLTRHLLAAGRRRRGARTRRPAAATESTG